MVYYLPETVQAGPVDHKKALERITEVKERLIFSLPTTIVLLPARAFMVNRTSTGLFYWEPLAPSPPCGVREPARVVAPLVPLHFREHLGSLLNVEKMKVGIEVGVQAGIFSSAILRRWRCCTAYTLVDAWQPLGAYHDQANVALRGQETLMRKAIHSLRQYPQVKVCRNLSVACAMQLEDESADFIYLDARHDYLGLWADLEAYWPKLRRGGIMAGHDYIHASEGDRAAGGAAGNDYSINYDGSRDPYRRAVKGAVDEWFTRCVPRQVVVTYREGNRHSWDVFNSWYVQK